MAWSVDNHKGAIPSVVYRQYDIPRSLKSKREVTLFLLEKAADLDPKAGAYYNLGLYYLNYDCEKAPLYFEKNLTANPGETDSPPILEAFRKCGCPCAHRAIRGLSVEGAESGKKDGE